MSKDPEDISEWTSIADLMAAFSAVVMMFFVVVVISAVVTAKEQKKKEQGTFKEYRENVMSKIKNELDTNIVKILIDSNLIRFPGDLTFEKGKACITDSVRYMLGGSLAYQLVEVVRSRYGGRIQIEGHSDTTSVSRGTRGGPSQCAAFDDNYSLSAQRARNVANELLKTLHDAVDREDLKKNMAVVGHGPNRLLPEFTDTSQEQRRVEIRIVFDSPPSSSPEKLSEQQAAYDQ
jgi:chemotaxis protein MotB